MGLPAFGQQTSGIQGVITDGSGAVIPGAMVNVTNIETGVARTVSANDVGFYTAPLLNPGRYKLDCTAPGFAMQTRPELRLETGQVARADFELRLGQVAETIEVSAAASMLQSEKTDVGQVVDNKRIVEMPLNGRNYLQLAQFSAGVLPSRALGRGSRTGDEGGFIAVGMHAAQNSVMLDGNDNSSRTSGGPLGFEAQGVKPPVDAVAEFKVVTNNTSAEFGYRAGAKVMVTTKSGTNDFHGSLYEFIRNDKLDGTNFFANRSGSAKPTYRQNQFGATFGGPVIKNRTFFFGSYQGTRIRLGQSYISSVPSLDIIQNGDFSKQPAQRRNIFDPLTTTGSGANAIRQPFAGNIIPKSRWDAVAGKVAALYPAPNIPGRENQPNNFFFAPSEADDADQYDFRVDHHLTNAHRLFVRYSIRNQFRDQPGPLPYPAMGGNGQTVRIDGDNIAANLSSTLSPTMFNEFRFGWSHMPTRFDIPFTENFNTQLGIKGAPGDNFDDGLDHGMTLFLPSGFRDLGPRGFWPNINNLDNLLIADALMVQAGRHTLKFGGEMRRANVYRESMRHRRGRFTFGGVYTSERPNVGSSRANTGNGMADMLLGWASGGQYGNAQGENIIVPYYGLFLQDDWKITPKLTVNMGLRWEMFQRPYFPNPERQTMGRWLIPEINGVAPGQEQMAFPKDGNDCGCRNDWNNFAPRFGIAYRLTDSTVLRTGGGMYYGEPDSLSSEAANFRAGAPNHIEINLNQPRESTDILVQNGFPPYVTGFIPDNINVYVFPDFRPTLYVGQWFFDIQQSLPWDTLLTVGYNGTKSTHLFVGRNINTPLTPHPTTRWQDRRIRPQFNAVNLHENSTNASYNSLAVKAEKRFSRGLTFISSFTWAHNIDQAEEDLVQGGSGRAFQYDLSRERGNSTLDRRLAYVLSSFYELPFGQGKSWLQSGIASHILGGWQVGGIVSLLSGMPVDHSFNVDNQNTGGRVRGDYVRNPNLPAGERSIDQWFDTSFVTASAPGVISNAGRNLIYSPGRRNFDLIVSKNVYLPWEGHYLQFRFESFNFTNTPMFGAPNTSVGSPAVGVINAADEPRRIQFGMKYVF